MSLFYVLNISADGWGGSWCGCHGVISSKILGCWSRILSVNFNQTMADHSLIGVWKKHGQKNPTCHLAAWRQRRDHISTLGKNICVNFIERVASIICWRCSGRSDAEEKEEDANVGVTLISYEGLVHALCRAQIEDLGEWIKQNLKWDRYLEYRMCRNQDQWHQLTPAATNPWDLLQCDCLCQDAKYDLNKMYIR